MPFALHIYVTPKSGEIYVEHVFYGHTEEEAEQLFETHADGCEFLGPAIEEDRVIEVVEEIKSADWPTKESLEEEIEEEPEEGAAPDPEDD